MYFTELCTFSFATFMPMQGRGGPNANPELLIALFCILYGILLGGFIVRNLIHCNLAEVIFEIPPRHHSLLYAGEQN